MENICRLPFCHLIDIENNFFGSIHCAFAAAVGAVLLTLFGTAVVVITVGKRWIAFVVFFYAADNFVVNSLLQRFCRCHDRIGISIFRFQVIDYFRVVFVFQPIIVIDTRLPEIGKRVGNYFRYRWCGKIGLF
ncbi:hypothetical protein SDC9_110140 [bioreactor metagenome]|uniref:Uncharacterized protein n=1 Tax=bioreactor metagenome TaxID=1076179 RepID=A0A645BCS0_9ZZZZ